WLMIVPFVIQLVLVVGAIGYLALQSSRSVATDSMKQLLKEMGQHIHTKLYGVFETYATVAQIQANDLILDEWPGQDLALVERQLWRRLREFKPVGQLVFSDPQGNLRGVSRLGGWKRLASMSDPRRGVLQWPMNDRGQVVGPQRLYLAGHPQRQSWFNAAVGVGQPTWSNLADRRLDDGWQWGTGWLLHYTWPLYDQRTGSLLGVLSADLNLADLSEMLRTIQTRQQGRAFIFTDEGMLVATSSPLPAHRVEQQGELSKIYPLQVQGFADSAISGAGYYLLDRFGGFRYLPTQSTQLYRFQGQRYLMYLERYQHPNTPDWWIAVLVPESEFLGATQETASTMLLLAGSALLLALGSGWWTVQQVLRPLEQLNQATGAAARIQFQPVDDRSGVREFDALAQTFNAMSATLRTSFEALQDSKSHLTQVLESLPMGVMVLDRAGSIQYINSVAGQLLQLPIGVQSMGQDHDQLHDRVFVSGTSQPFPTEQFPGYRALHGQSVGAVCLDVHQPQGRCVPLEARAVPLFDSLKSVTGAIVVLQDITDRKMTEELLVSYNQNLERQVSERTAALAVANHNLSAARDAAEQANRSKSVFLANVTHELRTPLHAILGFGQVLRSLLEGKEPIDQHQAIDHLEAIGRNGAYLMQLIDDLLSISRVETDHLALEPIEFDLLALLNDLHAIFEMRSRSTAIQFHLAMAIAVPYWVKGDGRRLRQILTNLLDNAFKFAGTRGSVQLSVSASKSDRLLFEVSNTGEGILTPEIQDIFEPFVQAKAGRRLGQGAGLGLAISQRLAVLMGGSLQVESHPGQITTFRLKVPLPRLDGLVMHGSEPLPPTLALSPSAEPAARSPQDPLGRILIVDPLPDRGQTYSDYLSQAGFAVHGTTNSWDTLRQWTAWQPQLVWFNGRLSGGEALATIRRIRTIERKNPTQHPCEIVVVAASPDEQACLQDLSCTLLASLPPTAPGLVDIIQQLIQPHGCCVLSLTSQDADALLHDSLTPHSQSLRDRLAQQSIEWRLALELAARSADEEQVRVLLAELPAEWQTLCDDIEYLLENFQLEQIADLAQP
ncbi:MAG TPA: ATP-binding protein, partial [Coleofasciculaceae cyanobacterium]